MPQQKTRVSAPRLCAIALAVAAALGLDLSPNVGPGIATAYAQSDALRPEIGKPLQQAAELLKANRAKEALAKVHEAEAVPNRTPAEQLTIDRMRGAAAARAGETQVAIKSFEATMASGRMSAREQTQTAAQLAFLYSQLKDWNKTRDWANRARQLGDNSAEIDKLLAFVTAQSGDWAQVARDAQAAIDATEKAGKKPDEADLLRLADALRRTGNAAGQAAALEKLLANYPKPEYWNIVLAQLQSRPGFSQRFALDVYRLRLATKTLTKAEDYVEMTQLALQERQAAEAKKVVDEGFANGVLGKGAEAERQKRLQALAHQRAASAPADLKIAEAEAADADALVRIGLAYAGLGEYEKGIALIQQGIKKGGLRHPEDAQLDLGLAYTRAGDRTKANQAFAAVKGKDGAMEIARLWIRTANQ
ncbi:MAG: tetratricopeptide repeat protein [Betaproteobacteria bacterium]